MKIILATPMYGGMASAGYISSLMGLKDVMAHYNIAFSYLFMTSESLITRARNILCDHFLNIKDATHLLFIDADIEFNALDILKLIESDKDIIGCPYPHKTILWDKVAESAKKGIIDPEILRKSSTHHVFNDLEAEGGAGASADIKEVFEIGTGIMLIKRHVFERIQQSDPSNVVYFDDPKNLTTNSKYYCFFDTLKENHRYYSEDYMFCNSWKRLGGRIYLLANAKTKHWGTYAYE